MQNGLWVIVVLAGLLAAPAAAQPVPPAPAAAQPSGLPPIAVDVPPLPAAPAARIALADALARAELDPSDVRVARLAVARAETAERAALAAILPQLTATASYTRYDQAVERMGLVVRGEDQIAASLVVSESISLRGIHATRLAAANTRVTDLQLRDAHRLARASVARTFFAALAAERAAGLARTQLEAAARAAAAVRARAAAGVALALDVARAEVAVLEATRQVADADGALIRAWDQLGFALGGDDPVAPLAPDGPLAAPNLAALEARALADRADVRAAEASRLLADLAVDDAWLRLGPTLTLSWTGSWNSQTTTFNPDSTSWTAIAALSLPLYDGGARYAARRDAEIALAQAEERIAGARRRARAEIRDAWRRLETAGRALVLAEQAFALADRAARDAGTLYAAGASSGLELEDARRRLVESQVEVTLRGLELELARVDLLAAAGVL